MKAKNESRHFIEKKAVLGEVAPLEAPFVLMIDPSSLCNFRCRFCPNGSQNLINQSGRYKGLMDLNVYKKIIDDLEEFENPIKTLRLYKEGEPLANPHFAEMVKYGRASKKVGRIDTTTNGSLLNPGLNRKIIDAGLDQINISVNGVNAEQFQRFSGAKIDFEKYVANIRDLYRNKGNCGMYIKAIKQNLSEDDQKKFLDIFGEITDRIFLENLCPSWPEFEFDGIEMKFEAGHLGQPIVDKMVCPYIFYVMVINADGRTSLCVGDWKNTHSYGDTKTESVKSIWLGEKINKERAAHLEGRRAENDFCASCAVLSHGTMENIDNYAAEIRQRLKEKFSI